MRQGGPGRGGGGGGEEEGRIRGGVGGRVERWGRGKGGG